MGKRCWVVCLLAIAACFCTGCGTQMDDSPVLPAMYEAEVNQALAAVISPLSRQALSDHWVSDAEFGEVMAGYSSCMLDRGWISTVEGVITYTEAAPESGNDDLDPSAWDQSSSEAYFVCWGIGEQTVLSVYWGAKTNPDGLSWSEQVRVCFQAHDVSDGSGLSPDQFGRMLLERGYVPSSDQAELCLLDPVGLQGVTLEQAASTRQSDMMNAAARSPAPA